MTRIKLFGLMSVVAVMIAMESLAGEATPSTIIVMPARRRMVELANQIARIKDVGLVAYNSSPTSTEPLIHIWNGTEWLPISTTEYAAGAFMSGEPKHLLLLGDNNTLPAALSANPTWCADVHRISSLEIAPLLNEMDKTLKFSARQWKWLAKLNGLVLTDQNVDRRRYGRWGAPGTEAASEEPKNSDEIVMPPAPIQPEIPTPVKPQAKTEPPVVEPLKVMPPAVEPAPAQPVKMEPAKVEPVKEESKALPPPVAVVEKPVAPPVAPPAATPSPVDK
jgi:hypothetical protein